MVTLIDAPAREHRHLSRRADLGSLWPIAEAGWRNRTSRNAGAPLLKLCTRPFEAVVLVAGRAGREALELHVVLGVWRRHDDRPRPGELEQDALESGEAGRIEVFDDLDDCGCIEALQPLVR